MNTEWIVIGKSASTIHTTMVGHPMKIVVRKNYPTSEQVEKWISQTQFSSVPSWNIY